MLVGQLDFNTIYCTIPIKKLSIASISKLMCVVSKRNDKSNSDYLMKSGGFGYNHSSVYQSSNNNKIIQDESVYQAALYRFFKLCIYTPFIKVCNSLSTSQTKLITSHEVGTFK